MSESVPSISVVIPVFNEAETLQTLYARLVDTLEEFGRSFEIVTVDDGSTDASVQILKELRQQDARLRIVRFSRNFGQSPALYAGLEKARGQYVVMLDADLQNYPEDIPKLVARLDEGYDMVSGYRANRQDSLFRNGASRVLNWFIARVTGQPLRDYGCALKAFRRELVDGMNLLTHRSRYMPMDAAWLGGRVAEVEVRHTERSEGQSKYGLLKLIRTAFDLVTSISSAPLQFIGLVGWVFSFVGFAMAIRVAWLRITQGDVNQMGSVIAIFFFLGGVQLIATGLMCEYVGRIYVEVQRKPYYVIQEEVE